jgi:hypothetical protein
MNYRRITGLVGAAGAVAVGTEIAQAQEDLGTLISSAVESSVSSIDMDGSSGGTANGGVITETNSVQLGEETGVAIADASGGNYNLAFES